MIKGRLKGVAKAAALCVAAAAYAAEPLAWERRPGRPAPAQFDTFHGETLQFRCVFEGFTPGGAGESGWITPGGTLAGTEPGPSGAGESGWALPFAPGADVRLWYQTNGMANLWWSVPATVASNVVSAAWPPSADPGAERVSFFFGAPSNAYAAAQVRFRNSPGSAPNALPTPTMVLDFANIVYTNAPWTTRAQVEAIVAESAPPADLTPATNYTDAAVSGLRAALATGEIEVQAAIEAHFAYSADNASHASSAESANYLGANSGIDESYVRGLRSSLDAVVASLDTKTTTNDVCNIVTNEIGQHWVFSPPSVLIDGEYRPLYAEWNDFEGAWKVYAGDGTYDTGWYITPAAGSHTGGTVPSDGGGTEVYATYGDGSNALGLARLSDLPPLTNGLIGADFIATNNPAFVEAVTNCPVAIAASDAEALAEWGIYGGGTIGALLAALAAAVAALKKKKMPLYPVGGTGNPVNATYESGVLTVAPFSMAAYAPTASAAFSVAMGALSDMESGKARDAVLVLDCSALSEGDEPTITWGAAFHPRTDAGTDFACVAGAKNVYYISEYAAGEFAVGGWTETAGGNA